jgi:Uma2 family endonuclease
MVTAYENPPQKFTPEEYLAWEEEQQIKHEYLGGRVYAMTDGTVNHGQIAINFATLLRNHLGRNSECLVLKSKWKFKCQGNLSILMSVLPAMSETEPQLNSSATLA